MHGPLVSLAALAEGAALAKSEDIVPGEAALRAHLQELQTECHNASFRIQYYYNQRNLLSDQISKVLGQLETHFKPA